MNKQEVLALKREGYLQQQDKEHFSLRFVTEAGNLTSDDIRHVCDIADKYGKGYVGFTTRQCVEIPWIKIDDIPKVKEEVGQVGLVTGGTGARVAPIASCKGTVCSYGIVDTQGLSKKLHNKFFSMDLPGKLKIGIVGCPNNCVKAPINDIGFMGQRVPRVIEEKCKGCRLCERACKVNSIEIIHKKAVVDFNKCIYCGQCIKSCPFSAMETEKEGVAVFIGGKFGRSYKIGERLNKIFHINEAEEITEKVINYYKNNANKGERIANTIERLGIEDLKAYMYEK